MKKVLSLILALTVLSAMVIISIPASAATPSIQLSSNSISTDATGNIAGLTVTVNNPTTYQSWLAIFKKSDYEASRAEQLKTGVWPKTTQYGWFYLQEGITDGNKLNKSLVPSTCKVDLSRKGKFWISGTEAPATGDYIVVLYDNDAVAEYAEGGAKYNKNIGGRYPIATADLHITSSIYKLSVGGMGYCGAPNDCAIWLADDTSTIDTYFSINKNFDAVMFYCWCDGGDADINLAKPSEYPWRFEILDTSENVVVSKEFRPTQGALCVIEFGKVVPKGSYIARFSGVEEDTYTSDDIYFCIGVETSLYPDCYSDHDGSIGPGAAILDEDDDDCVVNLSFHTVEGSDPASSEKPTTPTEGPSGNTEEIIDYTEGPDVPAGETENPENPGEETPAATDENGQIIDPTDEGGETSDETVDPDNPNPTKKPNKNKEDKSDDGLSTGAIIGIIAAAVVVIGGAAVAVILVIKKKKG